MNINEFYNIGSFDRTRQAESNAPTYTCMASFITKMWLFEILNFCDM